MKKTNKQNGITIIALVVTIILMLILASVTINVVIDGGLFGYAKNAKDNTEIASEKETVQKAVLIAESTSKTGRITVDEMQKAINKVASEENIAVMDNGATKVVKFEKSNRYYEIDSKGNVEGPKEFTKDEYAGDITKGGEYDGSEDEPFKITCIEDLVAFSIMTNGGNTQLSLANNNFNGKYVELTRTIDFKSIFSYNDYTTTKYGDLNTDGKVEDLRTELTKTEEGCIGFTPMDEFKGTFDGKENVIRNIYVNSTNDTGLFHWLTNATIKNIGITGEMLSNRYCGAIVAYAKESSIIDCYSEVNIVADDSNYKGRGTGGICGSLIGGLISNCYNQGNVKGKSNVGGIVGGFNGTIENCYNLGEITTTAEQVYKSAGGIAGSINYKLRSNKCNKWML